MYTYSCQTADYAAQPATTDTLGMRVLALPLLDSLLLGFRLLFGVLNGDILSSVSLENRSHVLRRKDTDGWRVS